MPRGFFITGPGTSEGKTFVCRALAAALRRSGIQVVALKPCETGIEDIPADATALARAAGHPLAEDPAFVRARLPLAPYAAALEGEIAPVRLLDLVRAVQRGTSRAQLGLVEGAGGLLVPLTRTESIAELAAALGFPLLLVAANRLGVLSNVLACAEAARARSLSVAAVILTEHTSGIGDPSTRTNQRILQERLSVPVLVFPACDDDDDRLADAAISCGLLDLVSR